MNEKPLLQAAVNNQFALVKLITDAVNKRYIEADVNEPPELIVNKLITTLVQQT